MSNDTDHETLIDVIYAHDPGDCAQGRCKCGQIIGTTDGVVWEMDPWGHLDDVLGNWTAAYTERIRAEQREIDAQRVHDWGVLHTGPEGAYAARVIEQAIREGGKR